MVYGKLSSVTSLRVSVDGITDDVRKKNTPICRQETNFRITIAGCTMLAMNWSTYSI